MNVIKKHRYGLLAVLGLIVVGMILSRTAAAQKLIIRNVEPLDEVENPAKPGIIRDGGASEIVSGGVLWTFGDSIFNPPSVTKKSIYTSTAGRADPVSPAVVSETFDANKAPLELIPLTATDEAYNTKTGSGSDRYAYWPYQVVPIDGGANALIYYQRLKISPGFLNYKTLNTGIAVVKGTATTATRVVDDLFPALSPDARLFQHPGFTKDGYIYFSDCNKKNCAIARVAESDALQANKYRFWNGSKWVPERAAAKYSLPLGSQIGWNDYLQKYVMVTEKPLQPQIYMRTSASLTNGWSEEQKIFTAPKYIYAARYQQHLDQNKGQSLVLSYYQPQKGPEQGLHLLKVNLADVPNSERVAKVDDEGNLLVKGVIFLLIVGGATVVVLKRKQLLQLISRQNEEPPE